MSIGDSALDFFSKEEILKNRKSYYKNKTYTPVEIRLPSSNKDYGFFRFAYKTGDKNYKILGMSGNIAYRNNISDCYKKQDEIVAELSEFFKNIARKDKKRTSMVTIDEPGDTKQVAVGFFFDSGDVAGVACYDYSKKSGHWDNLNVSIDTKEYNDFLIHKAYK